MKSLIILFIMTGSVLLAKADANEQGPKAGIEKSLFGKMPDGREVDLFTMRNKAGMEVKITNYGGYIVSMLVPDRTGKMETVTLGVPPLPTT